MKWKKPKKVKIGAFTFDIKYCRCTNKKSTLYPNLWGCIDCNNHAIWIDSSLKESDMKMVLLHELLHGVADTVKGPRNDFSKEVYIRPFSHMLMLALQTSGLIKN